MGERGTARRVKVISAANIKLVGDSSEMEPRGEVISEVISVNKYAEP
jgi:hypothetical protein